MFLSATEKAFLFLALSIREGKYGLGLESGFVCVELIFQVLRIGGNFPKREEKKELKLKLTLKPTCPLRKIWMTFPPLL